MLSARNQLEVKIKSVSRGAVSAEVVMVADAGLEICAIITVGSCIKMNLEPGNKVTAIMKASDVILATSEVLASTRNNLAGTIKAIVSGSVNDEIVIDVAGSELVSVITQNSTRRLELAAGKKVHALIKASNVMIMKD